MRLLGYLEDACIKSIAGLAVDAARTDYSRVTHNDGLKSSILFDPLVEVCVESRSSFSVSEKVDDELVVSGPSLSEGRLVDFVLGARRVKIQHGNLLTSKNSNISTGWLIVTAYYSAFFAAIELSRLHGLFPMSLDAEDFDALRQKICGNAELVDQFLAFGQRNYVGEIVGEKIVFRSSGDKPHIAAWDQVRKHVLKCALDTMGWEEVAILIYLLSGERNWKNPSQLRNEWNYKRADLFANSHRGVQFRKLIGNADGGQRWLAQTKNANEEDQISILAVLAETLCLPVIKSLERVRCSGVLERTF